MCPPIETILILLITISLVSKADWIRVPVLSTTDRSSHDHLNLDTDILIGKTDVKPLKYEDLEHIIGPGFEDELERFYQRHKMDFQGNSEGNGHSSMIDRNRTILKYQDPWSIYDHPNVRPTLEQDDQEQEDNEAESSENAENHNTNVEDQEHEYDPVEYDEVIDSNVKTVTTTKEPLIDRKKEVEKNTKGTTRFKLVKVRPKTVPSLSWNGFLNFLKDVQSSFFFGAARSIQDKVRMLENFRDTLMNEIEKRIKSLWPTPVTRNKRSEPESRHSHMDFPSSEAALMTISFLTFAVYLIKLVLQVINTIKSKHYSYNSFDTAATGVTTYGSSVIKKNSNARKLSTSSHDMEKIHAILSKIK